MNAPLSKTLQNATGRTLEPGHRVDLVNNGEVFDALEALIREARVSIHLVIYIWKPGRASDRVLDALAERRRAGVPVRIVVDRVGSRGGFTGEVMPRLQALGCEVRLYQHPLRAAPGRVLARNHRKLVVVDGQKGLVGGFCIWDLFLGDGRNKEAWRDTNLRLEGPGVRYLQEAFLENWHDAGGELPPLSELPWPKALAEEGAVPHDGAARVPVGVVHSSARQKDPTVARGLWRTVLEAPKARLWIASAYFAPEPELLSLLCARAQEGVDVRVLVPGPIHDVPPIREAGRAVYPALLRAGVRVYEYQASMMHAKTALVDDGWSVVGSVNLEPNAVNLLEENAAVVWSEPLAAQMARDFEADLAFAQELTAETVPRSLAHPARNVLLRGWTKVARWAGRRAGARLDPVGS